MMNLDEANSVKKPVFVILRVGKQASKTQDTSTNSPIKIDYQGQNSPQNTTFEAKKAHWSQRKNRQFLPKNQFLSSGNCFFNAIQRDGL